MISIMCFIYLVIVLAVFIAQESAGIQPLRTPAADFNKHRIVQPVVQHARTKREISTTRDTSGAHHSEVTMTVPIDGEEYTLDLRLNQDLVTDNHGLRYQENGKTVVHKPKNEEIDLCHYNGVVRDKPGSWVALSTCHGVQGIVFDGHTTRYIEPAQDEDITSGHYLYDYVDLTLPNQSDSKMEVSNSSRQEPHSERPLHRHKRYAPDNTQVRDPYNANSLSRYLELVLVADNKEFINNGRSIQRVYHQMKSIANLINSLFVPLNIFVALVGVEVWNQRDEINLYNQTSQEILQNFLVYRRSSLSEDMPNDSAQLLSGRLFSDGPVGKSYVDRMCNSHLSGGIASKHTKVLSLIAQTIAHEMGHSLGMDHDSDECVCPDEKCIMYKSISRRMHTHWSSCNLKNLTATFTKGRDYCLRNKPKRLFNSPTCGNGFVEAGEQCDCGTMAVPVTYNPCHACCNPDTCMLRANATCGAGTCCDLQTCRPKSAGTVCRGAERECDLPEYCTGHSEFCPTDVYKMDTTPCGKDGQDAYCVRGGCHSHTDQCRLLWGITGKKSIDECYKNNTTGDRLYNCGYYDYLRSKFIPCRPQDVMCGRLKCTHLDIKLQYGAWIYTTKDQYGLIVDNDVTAICHAVSVDLGLNDVDVGLVPDGAKCGDGMMCLKQKCVSVAAVREKIAKMKSSVCPSKCSGHGVCNSEGQCHCDAGFAPPLCALPGLGGTNSSPATDPTTQRNTMIALYVIFLGIIPSVALILLLIYCFCPTILRCKSSPQKLPNRESNTAFYGNIEFKSGRLPNFIHTLLRGPSLKESKNNQQTLDNNSNIQTKPTIVHLTNENISNKIDLEPNSLIYANSDYIKKFNVNNSVDPLRGNSSSAYTKSTTNDSNTSSDFRNKANNIHHMPKENLQKNTEKSPKNHEKVHISNVHVVSESNVNLNKNKNINISTTSDNGVLYSVKLQKNPENLAMLPNLVLQTIASSNHLYSKNLQKVPENDNLPNVKLENSPEKLPSKNNLVKLPSVSGHVNLPYNNLRKIPERAVNLANLNKLPNTDNVVNLFNVKLRKTAGNILD